MRIGGAHEIDFAFSMILCLAWMGGLIVCSHFAWVRGAGGAVGDVWCVWVRGVEYVWVAVRDRGWGVHFSNVLRIP